MTPPSKSTKKRKIETSDQNKNSDEQIKIKAKKTKIESRTSGEIKIATKK